ncbi:MAG: phosphatidate cytidylyltransferase [Gammaproteobacteria bacterium]
MSNLLARVLTATALGGFVVFGTLYLPLGVMQAFYALLGIGAALEFARLAGPVSRLEAGIYALCVMGLAVAGARLAPVALLWLGVAWWLTAAAWVIRYQARGAPAPRSRPLLFGVGLMCLVPALVAVHSLLVRDPKLLLALFALVWSADVFAYAGGRRFGQRKLASRVSPGKTWEGFASALLGILAVAVAGSAVLPVGGGLALLALALATFLASVVGDLLESLLKRLRGVKDSGTLLPGHGGVLDRVDSLLAAAPVFTLGLLLATRA